MNSKTESLSYKYSNVEAKRLLKSNRGKSYDL